LVVVEAVDVVKAVRAVVVDAEEVVDVDVVKARTRTSGSL
jgi:hypothetical protein